MATLALSLRDRQIGELLCCSKLHLLLSALSLYTNGTLLLASIQRILNLNHEVQASSDAQADGAAAVIPQSTPILNEDGDPIWKVLVFDNKGRDVISSVLRVNDLRAWGVTIHLYAPPFSTLLTLTDAFQEHKLCTISDT